MTDNEMTPGKEFRTVVEHLSGRISRSDRGYFLLLVIFLSPKYRYSVYLS